MKKALVIFALSIIFSNVSHAVFITLPNAQVLIQRLKALGITDITTIIEKTDLINQLAEKSQDTSELLVCVKRAVSDYMDGRESDETARERSMYTIRITEALLRDSPEALAEFTRYYKF